MKTIVCANEKGGVGKTTLAAHAAWYFIEAGLRVLVIDVDQQGNLSDTLDEFRADVPAIELFTQADRTIPPSPALLAHSTPEISDVDRGDESAITAFAANLQVTSLHYDVCVIDTPPALHTIRTITALYVADFVIAPVELGDYAIAGVSKLLGLLDSIPEALGRPPIEFLGLIPSKFHRASPLERSRFEALATDFGKVIFPGLIPKRDAYARSSIERRPVWKMSGTAAKEAATEIKAVMMTISEKMGMKDGNGHE